MILDQYDIEQLGVQQGHCKVRKQPPRKKSKKIETTMYLCKVSFSAITAMTG